MIPKGISLNLARHLSPSLEFQLPMNIIGMSHWYLMFHLLKLNRTLLEETSLFLLEAIIICQLTMGKIFGIVFS